jgi:aryl-alcohol dehydrogenase-like predicted oxidoreductase
LVQRESSCPKSDSGQRDTVFIATKVSGNNLRRNDVTKAAEKSLTRLETDTIDLYQLHWPNPRIPIGETMGAMEALVDQGKVRFIGDAPVSMPEQQRRAIGQSNLRSIG